MLKSLQYQEKWQLQAQKRKQESPPQLEQMPEFAPLDIDILAARKELCPRLEETAEVEDQIGMLVLLPLCFPMRMEFKDKRGKVK